MTPLTQTEAAEAVEQQAADLRARLRWQTTPGDVEREQEIQAVLDSIDQVMRPVRSLIGRLAWDGKGELADLDDRLRLVSKRLQYHRKQLKKMRRPDHE